MTTSKSRMITNYFLYQGKPLRAKAPERTFTRNMTQGPLPYATWTQCRHRTPRTGASSCCSDNAAMWSGPVRIVRPHHLDCNTKRQNGITSAVADTATAAWPALLLLSFSPTALALPPRTTVLFPVLPLSPAIDRRSLFDRFPCGRLQKLCLQRTTSAPIPFATILPRHTV